MSSQTRSLAAMPVLPSYPAAVPAVAQDTLSQPGASFQERLQDLPPAVAERLMAVGACRKWRRGQTLVHQGVRSGAVMACLQGRLAIMLSSSSGRDVLLRWLDAGEIVGLADVLANCPSPVSIVAQGSATTLHVAREDFVGVLQQLPEGALAIAVLLSRRVIELFDYVEMTGAQALPERLMFALKRLVRSQGVACATGGMWVKVTQAELATAARASRQRVHLVLRQWQAQGRVTLGYGGLTLHEAPPQPVSTGGPGLRRPTQADHTNPAVAHQVGSENR